MSSILYISAFQNEYNENVFIQRRKREVLKKLSQKNYSIDFIYNSKGQHPLELNNSINFYSKFVGAYTFANAKTKFDKIHQRLLKYSFLYPVLVFKLIFKKFHIDINTYEILIVEGWDNLYAINQFNCKNIYGRIYGTSLLTEKFEKKSCLKYLNTNYWKLRIIINSTKIKKIIFNSTGSRSRDLFDSFKNQSTVQPVYLTMPNKIFYEKKKTPKNIDNTLRLVCVSRIEENKGFYDFFRVVKYFVDQKKIDIHFDIIGSGRLLNDLKIKITSLGLEKNVALLGYLPLDEISKYYAKADILLNYYGFNPIIEALNSNTFVLTREFGEIGRILSESFSDKVYKVCLPNINRIVLNQYEREQFVQETIENIKYYLKNANQLTPTDFKPLNVVDLSIFAESVCREYIL